MGSIKGGLLQNHLIPAWNVTICRNKSGFLFNKLFITSLLEHKFYKKKQGLSLINISSFSTYLGRRPWHTSEWNVRQAGSIQPYQSHGMGSGKSLWIWEAQNHVVQPRWAPAPPAPVTHPTLAPALKGHLPEKGLLLFFLRISKVLYTPILYMPIKFNLI